MDGLDALDAATADFADVLAGVGPDDWERPSINPGWSVRDLVNHVVGGNRRYVLLLAGRPLGVVEAQRDVNHLSDDPLRDFRHTSRDLMDVFGQRGALEVVAHHRKGDRTGADLLIMRIMEHALHGWDLAQSIGHDYEVDDAVAATVLAAVAADSTLLARCGYPAYDDPPATVPSYRLRSLTGRAN